MRTTFYSLALVLLCVVTMRPTPSWAPPVYTCAKFSDVWPTLRLSDNFEDWRSLRPTHKHAEKHAEKHTKKQARR